MISVSLVSYNTSELLEKTLNLIFAQENVKPEVWVVDNNSSDNSVEMVKKKFPKVHLIISKKNLGFAKGQNLALREIKSDYTLILNPDTEFEKNTFSKILKFMKNNPEVGVSSTKILDQSGKLVSNGGDYPTGWPLFSWLFNLDKSGKSFHRSDNAFYNSKNIDWVGGTAMVVRKDVFEKIGYFNEDYFMYFEDVDFCYNAKRAGFQIGFIPDAEITHISGASSKNPRYNQWVGEFRGLLIFSFKNFGILYGFYVQILVYLAIIARIFAFAVFGKLDYASIYLKVLTNL